MCKQIVSMILPEEPSLGCAHIMLKTCKGRWSFNGQTPQIRTPCSPHSVLCFNDPNHLVFRSPRKDHPCKKYSNPKPFTPLIKWLSFQCLLETIPSIFLGTTRSLNGFGFVQFCARMLFKKIPKIRWFGSLKQIRRQTLQGVSGIRLFDKSINRRRQC